jgi:hypothetical protein
MIVKISRMRIQGGLVGPLADSANVGSPSQGGHALDIE